MFQMLLNCFVFRLHSRCIVVEYCSWTKSHRLGRILLLCTPNQVGKTFLLDTVGTSPSFSLYFRSFHDSRAYQKHIYRPNTLDCTAYRTHFQSGPNDGWHSRGTRDFPRCSYTSPRCSPCSVYSHGCFLGLLGQN